LGLIIHEIEKQARHIPIRQLVRRAGAALQALKPCFMMGPLSVAQYLAPGEIHFDVVVMDEASQVRPEDAIGAIARGAQVVIVGDPMQLPPTSFFERAIVEQDEEQADLTVAEEGESILDVAASVYQPKRRLRWHYRSRHHSLIAFSNKHFYDDDLVVFPAACSSSPNLGVRYTWIEGGVFEARRNSVEAQRVVEAVLEHVEQHPNESLGIATMNFEQCELIDGMLDKALSDNAAAQDYRAKWEKEGEPLFVKNLENVQGDERDVIFVSMTYGRDTRGNFYQRFGPINSAVGHRRLNVLFTRAKRRTVIFSSFDPSWVSLEPKSARGIKALKAYLEYAKTGVLDVGTGTGGGPESDFEVSVGGVLGAQGYAVVPQVGVNGFFIDLAVKHPNREGSYLIGIECDGASYHSARSARDRDRLRQMILENLGWRIYRIWSTDWFRYRQREVERLLGHIRQLLAMDEREDAERGISSMARSSISGGTSEETKSAIRRRLMAIREIAITECPDIAAERRLLRDPMLEVLLQKRPTNRSEWLEFVPYELRNATDLVDVKRYLSKVLDLFAEVA
jgi:very-short-patch-repair endonuclease